MTRCNAGLTACVWTCVFLMALSHAIDAARAMGGVKKKVFRPREREHRLYRRLFEEYVKLHDYLGRGANDVMKRLKAYKAEVGKKS